MALSAQSERATDCRPPLTWPIIFTKHSSLVSGHYWFPLHLFLFSKWKCEPKSKFELNSPEVKVKKVSSAVLQDAYKHFSCNIKTLSGKNNLYSWCYPTLQYIIIIYRKAISAKNPTVRNRTGSTYLDELQVFFTSETKTLKSLNQKSLPSWLQTPWSFLSFGYITL